MIIQAHACHHGSMPITRAEANIYPILLQKGDSVRLSQTAAERLEIKETSLLIWVDQAPDYRYSHPTYSVLIGATDIHILPGSWWLEVNGRRFPAKDRQVPGLVSPVEFSDIAVHVLPGVVVPGDLLTDGPGQPGHPGRRLPIKRESLVLWVDLYPGAKYEHDTRYVILDASGGRVVGGRWWPTFDGHRALGPTLASLARWDLDVEELPTARDDAESA